MIFLVSKISQSPTSVPLRTPASGIFPLHLPQTESEIPSTAKQDTPELIRKVRKDLTRRTSDTNIVEKQESSAGASRDLSKSPGRRRKFSLGSIRARSASLESGGKLSGPNLGSMPLPTVRKDSLSSSDSKKKDPKTFSMTIFVNESEKNKIVDLLHKAKSLISKKVEKVMGKKPNKASISNVDALQTVLESWMDREEEDEKEDDKLFEKLVKEQEKQVESMIQLGKHAPVQVPTLAVQEDDDVSEEEDDTIEEEPEYDLEVSRLTYPRYLRPPDIRRSRHMSDQLSSARSLSPVDNVPCPFGNRPESELYPPKLRRPSALYGAGALAATSRPPSRQVSISPSVHQQDFETASTTVASEIYDEEYEDEDEISARYARPASFTVPIGGVWRPGDDPDDTDVKWGTIPTEEEYLRSQEQEEGDCEKGFNPLE